MLNASRGRRLRAQHFLLVSLVEACEQAPGQGKPSHKPKVRNLQNLGGGGGAFLGLPRPRGGQKRIPCANSVSKQGSTPESLPWERVSLPFFGFDEKVAMFMVLWFFVLELHV